MCLRISVVMPVHNGATHIGEALTSILGQGIPDLEVIVVDDGSTDTSGNIAATYTGVTVIRQEKQGAAVARNAGVAVATGELLAFLDADDLYSDGSLGGLARAMVANPKLEAAHARLVEFHSPELTAAERARVPVREGIHDAVLVGTMMLRDGVMARTGPFPTTGAAGTDAVDWGIRCHDVGVVTEVIPEAIVLRRIHRTNTGRTIDSHDRDQATLRALRAAIGRRRTGPAADEDPGSI